MTNTSSLPPSPHDPEHRAVVGYDVDGCGSTFVCWVCARHPLVRADLACWIASAVAAVRAVHVLIDDLDAEWRCNVCDRPMAAAPDYGGQIPDPAGPPKPGPVDIRTGIRQVRAVMASADRPWSTAT